MRNLFILVCLSFLMIAPVSANQANNISFKELTKLVKANNDPIDQFNLGLMYYNGNGTEKNVAKAMELFEKSANQGCVQAQNNLAMMYYNEEVAGKNKANAKRMVRKIC